MARGGWLAIVCSAAAACAGNDEHVPTDSPPPVDQAPPIDDPPPDCGVQCGSCSKPSVFIDGVGGDYVPGASDDSTTNHSSILNANRSITGPGATRAVPIALMVRDALAAQGVQVSIADPGALYHVEVVLVSGTWGFPNQVAMASLDCQINANAVGFVNLTGSQTDADAAAAALFVIGAAAGLDTSSAANNCMNTAAAGCTFSATAATANNCGMATQDQPALVHAAFGCP